MIFDTDIIIWVQRGNDKAARLINSSNERYISIQTYMELLQNAKNKKQHQYIKSFLHEYSFTVLPLTENIGHRAAIYIEEYSLGNGITAGDAIIAATTIENKFVLSTGNKKHFSYIKDLPAKYFYP